MKNFLLGALVVAFVGGATLAAYQYGKKSVKNSSLSVVPSSAPTEQLVGNDVDEHGCKPSAGYSWCEAKQKCLRVWEEGCPVENDKDLLKQALFKKNNWSENDGITVTVSTNDGKYASGMVAASGGGGYFFAAKVSNVWEIVADGNGTISCSSLTKYPDFPKNLIPECYDQTTGKPVKR